ncbi:MAG: hypothetical protein K2M19_04615 [Muribaculaceae bacterium]|nr:hypothetical protein [Muribaculaceae bacterium]
MLTLRKAALSLALIFSVCHLTAQSSQDAFNAYRQQLLQGYQDYRKSILDDYDKYLEGIWEQHEQFKAGKRFTEPKPAVQPDVKAEPVVVPEPEPVSATPAPTIPEPEAPTVTKADPITPGLPAPVTANRPDAPNKVDVPRHYNVPDVTPTHSNRPGLPTPSAAVRPDAPTHVLIPRFTPEDVDKDSYDFDYRGMELSIADVPLTLKGRLNSPAEFAAKWRELKSSDAVALAEAMVEAAQRYNLNDFLTYDVLKAYVLARYPNAHPTAQMALVHFVLANMGYDARLGIDDSGNPYLLLPFDQKVYARHFLTLNGRQYYVFPVDSDDPNNHARSFISTCKLPEDADPGKPFDLIINDLRLPEKPKEFAISQGGMTITGSVNENLIPVLYRYPQMATEDFASSNVSPALRADVVNQFKQQLAAEGKSGREAIDALLRFTQSGFKYATDDEYHGFEKPYFFEETLYYPKCDCEDRSIFYTFLLWNVLGVENHLIAYPIHEAAAVRLDEPISGDNYQHEGKTFYISDPTYIGARTGQCMPRFKTTPPKIDKEYR